MAKAASNAFKVVEHVAKQIGLKDTSMMQREAKSKARDKAERARIKARRNLKEMPDEKSIQLAARKSVARKRAMRSGRASTILSSNQTLG